MMKNLKVVSLFSGCGGLDLGFSKYFDIIFANEYDKTIWETYEKNHKETYLDKRSIVDIPIENIPHCDGILAGPPCQSWSLAGKMDGIKDKRGQLIFNLIDIIKIKKPKFFIMENVKGMVSTTHIKSFKYFIGQFEELYNVSYEVLNCDDYGVGQLRERLFIIGLRKDLGIFFDFRKIEKEAKVTLKTIIGDLPKAKSAIGIMTPNKASVLSNHEYYNGGYSSQYMSRNRKKYWNEPSFTIQASGRHAPIHPSSPDFIKINSQHFKFKEDLKDQYRRLSIRECARIQGFPDDFIFYYKNLENGYKMVGNAVPVKMAEKIAKVLETLIDRR